jgi:hypothetical protein
MKTKAIIDRFEGDTAVLLVGDEQDRLIVKKSSLPKGVKEGDWLQVEVKDDRVFSATTDPQGTADAKKRIQDKLNNLREGKHKNT